MNRTTNSKQAAWVAVGTFFSYIVGIVSSMILSRYLDKGDYGTYKQVMYVYNTLLGVFTLGLPKAYSYFLPKYSIEYSKSIINKITRIFFVLGFLFSLLLLVSAGLISSWLKNPDLKVALIVFSPTPFFLLPTLGLDAIYATFKKTQYLAFYTIATRVLTIFFIVCPVIIFSSNYIYAIIGFDIASLITFLLAIYLKTWPVRYAESQKVELSYKKIFSFSLPLFYASLWGVIISSSNQFFVSRYFGNEVFAEFSNGFMELPFVGMVMGAISAVLLPVFSGMDKGCGMSKESLMIWKSVLIKSAKLIYPMLIYSILFAEILMKCMYGDIYSNSYVYFIIKNISGLFCILPFYPIILAIGKTKDYANIHMLIAIIIVIVEWIVCNTLSSALYVAIASELCRVFKIYLLMCVIANYAKQRIIELIQPFILLKLISISIVASIIPLIVINIIDLNKFIALIFSLLLFIISYYFLCHMLKVSYKEIFEGIFKGNPILNKIIKYIP